MELNLFPFAEYWWLYAGFTCLVVFLLALTWCCTARTA